MSTAEVPENATTVSQSKASEVRFDRTPEAERPAVQLVERVQSKGYVNSLTPPAGTSYWRTQTFIPMNNVTLSWTDWFGTPFVMESLTWRINAYVYVVNARPDGDFQRNGGAVYIVLVHTGAAATGASVGGGMEYHYNVTLRSDAGMALKQLPQSNSGVQSGDDRNYPISFRQDMSMFKNDGNEPFTFSAQYEDNVDIHKGQQTGYVASNSSVQWGVVLDNYPDFYANFPFAGFSVFQMDSLGQFTFDCEASVSSPALGQGTLTSNRQSIVVNCQFSV